MSRPSRSGKDRHLLGAGAAACAVCCTAPLMGLLGLSLTGVAASVAALAVGGLVFGLVVLGGTAWAVARRAAIRIAPPAPGPDDAASEPTGRR